MSEITNKGNKSFDIESTKKKGKATIRITKNDLKVVAPYLWVRRSSNIKHDRALRYIALDVQDFSMDVSDISKLGDRLEKTCAILKKVTESTGVKLYMVDKVNNEIYLTSSSSNTDSSNRMAWSIGTGKTIAAHVAYSKKCVITNDIYEDERFPEGVGWGGLTITGVICAPIVTGDQDCSAVIEVYRDNGIRYVQNSLDIIATVSGWMGSAIDQKQKRIMLSQKDDVHSSLLLLTNKFLIDIKSFEHIISDILYASKAALNGERGTFFVLNKVTGELVAEIFDEAMYEADNSVVLKKKLKLKNKLTGIAALAVESRKIVNIQDAYHDPRYTDKVIDQQAGMLTRSVLCMPILDNTGVLGIFQLINKLPAGVFTKNDEELFTVFGIYCTIIFSYKQQNEKRIKLEKLNEMYNDILMYRMKQQNFKHLYGAPSKEDVLEIPEDYATFSWCPYPNNLQNMIALSYYMVTRVCGPETFEHNTLMDFLIAVKKYHRDIPYHNFEHAFIFMHCIFCILERNSEKFDKVDKLSLLIGAICHDIDHPGYTNVFLQITNSPLATLYDESFLENHHVWFGQNLINTNELLSKLTPEENARFVKQFRSNIMATDLTEHLFQSRLLLEDIAVADSLNWENETHRTLIRGLMMTSADLCGLAKPFRMAKRLIDNLCIEFYNQGDKEKALGLNPLPLMDRTQYNRIPELQVQFMRSVTIPCFLLCSKLVPFTDELYTNSQQVNASWLEIIEARETKTWNPDTSVGLEIDDETN